MQCHFQRIFLMVAVALSGSSVHLSHQSSQSAASLSSKLHQSNPLPSPAAVEVDPRPASRSLRRRRADLFKISASNRRSTLFAPRLVRTQQFLSRPTDDALAVSREQVSTRVSVSQSVGLPVLANPSSVQPVSGAEQQDVRKRVRLVSRRKLMESKVPAANSFDSTVPKDRSDFSRRVFQAPVAVTERSNDANFGPDTERPLIFPQFLVPKSFINTLGSPQVDYPELTILPRTFSFSCEGRLAGFYADPQHGCQVYHNCLPDGRLYSHMCGVGTVFNQKALVCDHYFNYDCATAEKDYASNKVLYDEHGRFLF